MSGARTPTIDAVAAYLVDAARQESSVYTVVSVVKQFVADGLAWADVLRAVDHARAAAPAVVGTLARYERSLAAQLG